MNPLLLAATLLLSAPTPSVARDTPPIPASTPTKVRTPSPHPTMKVGEHVPLGEARFDVGEATFMRTSLGAMAHQSHKQLKVAVHPDAFIWIMDIDQAIKFWNATANREVFVLLDEFPTKREGITSDVVLVFVAPDETINLVLGGVVPEGVQAAATRMSVNDTTGELTNTLVLFPTRRFEASAEATARHEFGHVLGLDHDINENSLMAAWSGGLGILSFTDFMAIRVTYGQE